MKVLMHALAARSFVGGLEIRLKPCTYVIYNIVKFYMTFNTVNIVVWLFCQDLLLTRNL
jgi:hypothetical protein